MTKKKTERILILSHQELVGLRKVGFSLQDGERFKSKVAVDCGGFPIIQANFIRSTLICINWQDFSSLNACRWSAESHFRGRARFSIFNFDERL